MEQTALEPMPTITGLAGTIAALMTLFAIASVPAQAAIFKCKQGTEIVYSDKPCPDAKVVDTTNGKRPQIGDYYAAQARALRDKIKLADAEQQEARERQAGRDCLKRVRDDNWTQTTAAKYRDDPWWQNRAADSSERLSKDCSKHLIPQGAR
jgi:hypothetical protein